MWTHDTPSRDKHYFPIRKLLSKYRVFQPLLHSRIPFCSIKIRHSQRTHISMIYFSSNHSWDGYRLILILSTKTIKIDTTTHISMMYFSSKSHSWGGYHLILSTVRNPDTETARKHKCIYNHVILTSHFKGSGSKYSVNTSESNLKS